MSSFYLDPNFAAVAFTGGDVGGKTTIMTEATQYLEARNIRAVVSPEIATRLFMSNFHYLNRWKDPLDFQHYLLKAMLDQENLYYKMMRAENTRQFCTLLCDRGAKDAGAYVGEEGIRRVARRQKKHVQHLMERYRAVIHLVTAADGAEEAYLANVHNNPGRIIRSVEEARELDRLTMETWYGHPHLVVIDNSTDFIGKIERALNALHRVILMPKAKEQERKFVVLTGQIPKKAVSAELVQDYLTSDDPLVERRVRMRRGSNGVSTYYYTEKRPTDDPDVREENERQIVAEEYANLLVEKNPEFSTVRKTRWMYVHGGKAFEEDVYLMPISDERVIELENCPMEVTVEPPPGYTWYEVTGRKEFSNAAIAAGRYPVEEVREMKKGPQ